MTLPVKDTFIGPIFSLTTAFMSFSPVFSIVSQPGMHWRNTSRSFSAA